MSKASGNLPRHRKDALCTSHVIHKKNKASTVQAIFDNFLQRNKTEFLMFVIFYITMY